ncbi:unnamed protein product [Caenorhabditis sp. 36 PRJEB53466]|nr:unnamed protein product [Caenorhabditis sp. 36 PRJEB53466]
MNSLKILILLSLNAPICSEKPTPSQILNKQLAAVSQSLTQLNVSHFQELFNRELVDLDTVFQPNFLYPNNVFASMGDSEFKNSLKIFSSFEPTLVSGGSIRALVTIKYKMGGQSHKMDKEVAIAKDSKSPTGYVFAAFKTL